MTQKTLALIGAALGVMVFVGANAHLIALSFQSQPGCVETQSDRAPARHAC